MTLLDKRLSDFFGYEHCIFFGRARSGLVALLEIFGGGQPYFFVMPSNICPVLYTVALSCGATTRLCPVDLQNGLAGDEQLASVVSECGAAGLVMPANLYGFVQEYPETIKAARKNGWFILENDVMATKARCLTENSRTAFGDALLISFGDGKSIDAGGGGAILTDDPHLAENLRRKAAIYPPLDDLAQARENWLLAYRLHLKRFPEELAKFEVEEWLIAFERDNLRYSFPGHLNEKLAQALDDFRSSVTKRRERAKIWDRKLFSLGDALRKPDLEQVVPWRLIRRAPGNREKLATALRSNDIDVGVNFSPLTESFPVHLAEQAQPDADLWGSEVLNFWVSDEYNAARMENAVGVMKRVLD